MKKYILLILIIITGFTFISFNMYDNSYTILQKFEDVEIRAYEPAYYASYAKLETDSNSQFRVLANYIFGGNEREEQISMTSPVNMKMYGEEEMLFKMPENYTLENLPRPNDSSIKMMKMEERRIAAIKFSGYSNAKKVEKYKAQLIQVLKDNKVRYQDKFELLVYDAPYKLLNRRNEIIVILK
jgi:hypothetical protein